MLEILKNNEVVATIESGSRFYIEDERRMVFNVTLATVIPGYTIREYVPPEPEPEPITSETINLERDRRIEHNFTFVGTAFQLDNLSQQRITAMGADARFAVLGGAVEGDYRWADPDNDFGWIATDNTVIPMDAQTMVAFSDAAKIWVIHHTYAARTLKDMDPIPEDYMDDKYWPQQETQDE